MINLITSLVFENVKQDEPYETPHNMMDYGWTSASIYSMHGDQAKMCMTAYIGMHGLSRLGLICISFMWLLSNNLQFEKQEKEAIS